MSKKSLVLSVLYSLIGIPWLAGCQHANRATNAQAPTRQGPPSAQKMAEALKAVGWITSSEGTVRVTSPWGRVGEDGYTDYRVLLKDKDLRALATMGMTPDAFVAGMKAINPIHGLAPVTGTQGRLNMPVSDTSEKSDYGRTVTEYITKQSSHATGAGSQHGHTQFTVTATNNTKYPLSISLDGKDYELRPGQRTNIPVNSRKSLHSVTVGCWDARGKFQPGTSAIAGAHLIEKNETWSFALQSGMLVWDVKRAARE